MGYGRAGVQGQMLPEPVSQSCHVQEYRLYTVQLKEMLFTQLG